MVRILLLSAVVACVPARTSAADQVLTPRLHHLRNGDVPEWSDFQRRAEAAALQLAFLAQPNATEYTLRLRQQDVRQTWKVLVNGKELARLVGDENDMVVYFPVPSGTLRDGKNMLSVEQTGKTPDDIRVGEITLIDRPMRDVL